MVAGHDYHLAIRSHPPAQRPQDGLGGGQRAARVTCHELGQVTQEHEAVDAIERFEQHPQRLRVAEHGTVHPVAQVQI